MASGTVCIRSAHGPGVMFFRIAAQPVKSLFVATDKNTVIHYPFGQSRRVPVRSLIGFPIPSAAYASSVSRLSAGGTSAAR